LKESVRIVPLLGEPLQRFANTRNVCNHLQVQVRKRFAEVSSQRAFVHSCLIKHIEAKKTPLGTSRTIFDNFFVVLLTLAGRAKLKVFAGHTKRLEVAFYSLFEERCSRICEMSVEMESVFLVYSGLGFLSTSWDPNDQSPPFRCSEGGTNLHFFYSRGGDVLVRLVQRS